MSVLEHFSRPMGSHLDRPLPDERPRQSVANLIGRFEQQGKRQASPALPVVPRSSSVSSQITGDAAREESKEKREWPPKPVPSTDIKPFAPTLPSPNSPKSPVVSPQTIPEPAPPAILPITPTPASPEPAMSPPPKPKPVATGKSNSTTGTRRTVTSPAKRISSNPKPSVTSPPAKTSLQSSVSQPLKPQHTGQSVTSNPSTIRQTRPVPRTAPSTPSRPKSSTAQSQAVPRPKTPSSGLFAPTAASLARSRNAPPPPPPPVKKVTLSSDAAERLSKPTAASLSKARTPVSTAQSPTRVAKSTSSDAHGPPPRGSSKLKVGGTFVKPKEVNKKDGIKTGSASVSSQACRDSDQGAVAIDRAENGDESGTVMLSDPGSPADTHGHSESLDDAVHDLASNEDVPSDPGVERQADDHAAEVVYSHEHAAQDVTEGEAVREHEQVHLDVHDDDVADPVESDASEVVGNGNNHKVELVAPGNEIEDIVNLLEGTSLKPRPQSIVSIPDEDGENEY